MDELDFVLTETETAAKDFEFTKKAAQRFRQIVSLESFEDEDANVIFRYLYKEMELVSFGDHLKRYIYERAGLTEPFNEVPMETYREIALDSFQETRTPKSMNPTSTKLPALLNNWLSQASVKRETVFLLGFGLRMTTEDVSDFLTRVLREQDIDLHNPEELIYWYCYSHQFPYSKADELKKKYADLSPAVKEDDGSLLYGRDFEIETEQKLMEYLSYLKAGWEDPRSEKSRAFGEFMRLLEHSKQIIASMYQQDEEEKGRDKIWTSKDITPADLEKVICNGIPVNEMGNLKKMSASTLAKHFSQKRFSRQRITSILNHKFPVERFDMLTLEFFIISQEMADEDPYERYRHFIHEAQGILADCGMGEIYIVNPYECFLLMCLLTDCPLAVFSEIWEKSYETTEEEET